MQGLTKGENCDSLKEVDLTEAQLDFLKFCKEFGWGKLEVVVQAGEPAFSREIERTHQHKKH